ncbi:MAG TPA: glycoside hydrolase family 9 protein [Anaerohalosphaeraceae bacterium]|nr:glycoside hydrolase family 9 protein [Anaerohalosphaeraceae bacterium]HOL87772.1 glycoside hydrolase family 9 protein [Anaerohalosphaeraceae bacterium]HPP55124.1 glycoside hydrolase family 9 protein [Anaerohalosphaeraceae bacterium]
MKKDRRQHDGVFRYTRLRFFILVCCWMTVHPVFGGQECIGINFFDPVQSYLQTFTCWDGNKSYVYLGSPATFVHCQNAVPVNMSIGSGSLVLESTLPGGWWNIQFKLDWGHSVNLLRTAPNPFLHLRVKWGQVAPGADLRIRLTDDQQILNLYRTYAGQSSIYSSQTASVLLSSYVQPSTAQWQDVYIPMSDFLAVNPNLDLTRLSILTLEGAGRYSQTNTLYIEKMRFVPGIDCVYSDMVKVNQLGYRPDQRKLAVVSYEAGAVSSPPSYFQVVDAAAQRPVYQGPLLLQNACESSWNLSGDIVYHADFTELNTPGRYWIEVPEIGQRSPVFTIHPKTFNRAFRDALRFFYYARSGYEIAEPFAEGHSRPAIYANNETCRYDYDDNNPAKMYDYDPLNIGIETRDVRGGWFDAGDLHLDVHNNLGALWFLLETLRSFGQKTGPGVLHLPESDGLTNDLILLIQYQLEWFKKMQNPDGSVHFIVITNDGNLQRQTVSDVSSGAACVLAAVFAKAYSILGTIEGMEPYAQELLSRAELSWGWLTAHPNTYNPTGPSGSTWSYGITNDLPYRGLAAVELYIATGNSTYRTYFESRYNSASNPKPLNAFGGNSYYGYIGLLGSSAISKAYMDYIRTDRPVSSTIKNALIQSFLTEADALVNRRDCNPYNIPMLMYNDLYWGSSGMLCGNAYVLLWAYERTGSRAYLDAALDVLDWIGGRNPVSRVFITGFGDYLHGTDLYSFYWFDHLNPVPGYLCGNINHHLSFLQSFIRYPWKCYMNLQNAGLLEPCLPWQAQMCYLLGYFASDLTRSADLNDDGQIEQTDWSIFTQSWLSEDGESNWNPFCDLNVPPDQQVDIKDLAVFVSQWLNP